MGVGAACSLRPLLEAQETAIEKTQTLVEGGGGDVLVTGQDAKTKAMLATQGTRDRVVERIAKQLSGKGIGQRVFAVGGDVAIKDVGLKPVDVFAPGLMELADAATLGAVGFTPIYAGREAGNYAQGALQMRVQYDSDRALAKIVNAALHTPVARHFARRAGLMWRGRADRGEIFVITDLSSHPGALVARSEAIKRMREIVELGWTSDQAAAYEDQPLPKPEGQLMISGGAQGTPGPSPGSTGNAEDPRRPVGDGDGLTDGPAEDDTRSTTHRHVVQVVDRWKPAAK
jgi:hypothetical protein